MTRKDFELVASIITRLGDRAQQDHAAFTFANQFKQHCANFNREKFLQACGVDLKEYAKQTS